MQFRFLAVLLGAIAVAQPAAAHTPLHSPTGGAIAGRVTDAAGHGIPLATVAIVELARAATTAADGSYSLADIPAGKYTVSVRRLGFVPVARVVEVTGASVNASFALVSGVIHIEPVNVTATPAPVVGLNSPLPTSELSDARVNPDASISLAHSIDGLPGVHTVSSGKEIGKPMIRGLFGPRVLVLANGSRLEDYSWSDEDGPSIDPTLAQRVEVIRGPASVLYGSDAMGGVVNVVPEPVPTSPDGSSFHRESGEAYGGSNNIELGGVANLDGVQSGHGWRLGATGRFAQNYQTPTGTEANSSFWAFTGEGAVGFKQQNGNTTIRLSHYSGEFHLLEATGPESSDLNDGPVRQVADERLQVVNEHQMGGVRLETKAQWQLHNLAEVSDDCVPTPPATTCVKVKDKQAFGLLLNTGTLDVLAHHTLGAHITGSAGVSGMLQFSNSSGPIYFVPSATIGSGAAYLFEQLTAGPMDFVGGGRVDFRDVSSDANTQLALASDSRSWTAPSGDVGVVYHLAPELALVANAGYGWRAPTLFDLYANGPNLADARYEQGTPTLATERSLNVDGSVRWQSDRVKAEATVFNNKIDNYIYTTPTTGQKDSLPIYLHTQADAHLSGAELSAEVTVADPLTVHAAYDVVQGTDRRTDVPLPLMAPPRTIVGAVLHGDNLGWAQRASAEIDVENDARQTRLNPADFATAAYTVINLAFAIERPVRTHDSRFTLTVQNAANATYRDFLSRYKTFANAPGINVTLKAATMW